MQAADLGRGEEAHREFPAGARGGPIPSEYILESCAEEAVLL